MTIDERLEALVQSVELLAGMQKNTDERLTRLIEAQQRTDRALRITDRHIRKLTLLILDHEARLQDLEDEEGDEADDGAAPSGK